MTSERATLNAVPEQGSQRCERSPVACPREKAGGHYAAGLLLQLPSPLSPVPLRFHASKSDPNIIKTFDANVSRITDGQNLIG